MRKPTLPPLRRAIAGLGGRKEHLAVLTGVSTQTVTTWLRSGVHRLEHAKRIVDATRGTPFAVSYDELARPSDAA